MVGSVAGAVSAGNIADTSYEYYSTGEGFAMVTRDKTDYSLAYIYHYGKDNANVQVCSGGVNYSANGGAYWGAAGSRTYLLNYVKENGFDNCYLYISPFSKEPCYMYGDRIKTDYSPLIRLVNFSQKKHNKDYGCVVKEGRKIDCIISID